MLRDDRPHVGQPQLLLGRGHFQDEIGFALGVGPKPLIQRGVLHAHGHVFHRPQTLARRVSLGPEAAEEVVLREVPAKFLGHLQLARTHQSRDDRNPVALPRQRIVGRLAGRRPPIQESHHQVGDLRVETIYEALVRQIQGYGRTYGGVVQRDRPGRPGVAEREPGRMAGANSMRA